MGEDAEAIGPKGPKGFHLAPFVAKDDGFYQAVARQARTVQQGDGPKVVTLRIAKTAFAAFKNPTLSAARSLKGFDRLIAGEDGVEFIPLQNPLAVFANGSLAFELRYKGRPLGGQTITLVRRIDGFASVLERTSDEKGRMSFPVGPADSYLVRVKIDEESARADGLKDKASYESTYVFRFLIVLSLAVVLVDWSAITPLAWAHAYPAVTVPSNGATLKEAPRELRIQFTEGVEIAFSQITVKAASGEVVSQGNLRQLASDTLAIDLKPLSAGNYSVEWQVLSVDTHVTDGVLRFTVGAPAK